MAHIQYIYGKTLKIRPNTTCMLPHIKVGDFDGVTFKHTVTHTHTHSICVLSEIGL